MPYDKSEGSGRRRRKTGTRKSGNNLQLPSGLNLGPNNLDTPNRLPSGLKIDGRPTVLGGDLTGNLADFLNNTDYQPGGSSNRVDGIATPQRVAPQVTMQKRAAKSPGAPEVDSEPFSMGDQFDALNALAMSMLTDSAGATYDYETAIQESTNAIKKAYGAEIKAIRNNNKSARRQTKKDRKELEDLYKGLAKSYGGAAQQAVAQGENTVEQLQQIAAQSAGTINAQQMQSTQDQAQMLKDLGLEATADQIITPDFAQSADSQAQIASQSNNAQTLATQLAGNQQGFMRRGKQAAKMEGVNQQGDLMDQLRNYVRGNRDQIAVLKGQRAREISQNKNDTMAAAAEAEASAQSDMWDRLMEYAGLQMDVEQANFNNNLAANKFQYQQDNDRADRKWDAKKWRAEQRQQGSSGSANSPYPENLSDAMSILQNQSSQPQILAEILQGVWESKDFAYGQKIGQNGETYKLTPAMAANMAERAARQRGIKSEQDIQAIRLAAYRSAE